MKKPRILDRLRVWLIVKLGGYVEQVQKVVRVEHMLPSGFEEVTLKSSLVIGDEELMAIVCHENAEEYIFSKHKANLLEGIWQEINARPNQIIYRKETNPMLRGFATMRI